MSGFGWHPCLGTGGLTLQRTLGSPAFDIPDHDEPGGDVVFMPALWDNGAAMAWVGGDSINYDRAA